jgi:hypothetical protein
LSNFNNRHINIIDINAINNRNLLILSLYVRGKSYYSQHTRPVERGL